MSLSLIALLSSPESRNVVSREALCSKSMVLAASFNRAVASCRVAFSLIRSRTFQIIVTKYFNMKLWLKVNKSEQ